MFEMDGHPLRRLLKVMDVDLGPARTIGFCFGEGLDNEPDEDAPIRLGVFPRCAETWFRRYRRVSLRTLPCVKTMEYGTQITWHEITAETWKQTETIDIFKFPESSGL